MVLTAQLVQPVPQTEAPQRHRPIDLVYLARHTSGDTRLERDVLRMFNQVSRTYFSRIQTSTNIGDVCRNLHSLKGAATSVGAWSIAGIAKAMEDELASGATVDPERIGDLDWAIHEVNDFVTRMLKDGLV